MAGSKYKIEMGIAGVEKTVAGINKVRSASQARAAAAEARRRLATLDLEEKIAAEKALPPKQRLAKLEQERERNKKRLADAEAKLQAREKRGLKSPAMDHRVQSLRLANREIDRHIAKIRQANNEGRKGIFSRAGSAIGGSVRGMVATAGAYMGLRAGRQTLSDAGSLQRNASTIGVGTDFLQEMQFGGLENSIDERTTSLGVQRFARRFQEAKSGKGELRGTLNELGIDPANMGIEEGMKAFADAIAALPEDQRLRHAFKAFDSEGAKMVTMLSKGAAGLDAMAERARDAGAVMEAEVVMRLAEADKQLTLLGKSLKINFAETIDSLLTALDFVRPAWELFVDGMMTAGVFILRMGEELLRGNFLGAADKATKEADSFATDRNALRERQAKSREHQRNSANANAPAGDEVKIERIQNDIKKSVDQLQQIGGFRGAQSSEAKQLDQQTQHLKNLNREMQQLRQEMAMSQRRLETATREAMG